MVDTRGRIGHYAPVADGTLTAAQRRRVAFSLTLACAWLAILLALGFIAIAISLGGSGGLAVVPFMAAAGVAMLDRVRNRLTAPGSIAVAIASIAVVAVAAFVGSEVWRGGGNALAGVASVAAIIAAVSDIFDRWGTAKSR